MQNYTLLIIALTFQVIRCDGSADWRSGPPDSLPEITKLSVECGKQEMTIYLQFSGPYDGSIYSKPNGQSGRCIHVPPHSHITETTFTIEYDDCGTRSDPQGKFYENTIVIQYDDIVIEAWDEAKKIRCEWHDGYEKSAFKMPITISDLDVVEMNFQGDDVDCWLEVQDGKGPWSAKVEGLVPLGSPLTLVVAIQDSEGHFDMRVKSCIAHDGQKHPIHLTDEEGCVLRPKMMTHFQKTTETKGTASVIAYSHFYAFKFPETVEVTIQCTVEICRHGCPGTCIEGRDSQPPESDFSLPKSKESDDIPTYKDSFPFSTVITSRPNQLNQSSNLNTSSSSVSSESKKNDSKEDNSDPLDTSPNTNYDFYMNKYPYDLFDDLLVEERQDDKIEYDRPSDKDYADNNDDVYYSQLPNIFNGLKEHGKNFPAAQKIHALSNTTTTETDLSAATDNPSESPLPTETDLPTVPNLSDLTTLAIKMGMHTSTTELGTEPNTTQIPIVSDNSKESLNYQRVDDTVVIKDSSEDHSIQEAFKSTETANDSITFGTTDRSGDIFLDSNDYNDANVESRQTDYEFNSNRKRSEEDLLPKKDTELHFEDYKVKARKPFDNYDIRQNYRYRTHKSFLPPAPAPPITLYNGVPLHYYTQSNPNVDYFDEENHPYLSRFPYQKNYVKSKLRRPGRRRGRRDIGEKEQLGLKQTLRVIAIEDLDFFPRDHEKIKPLYVGKTDVNADVCMAPSSLAAGLGLLLLANICVICIVIFLGHHYYIHKKAKVKTVELLGTELS
ncbi:ZP domain-containing protein [Caerostris darwini]|uniref:ZP domain-containing protein n=1 Tax=Caerostris darwini TaxID=1538125 RepID=A0AAV4QKA8_9ARAC|nr:ZP domain-containing protein [Caerostris darwini]